MERPSDTNIAAPGEFRSTDRFELRSQLGRGRTGTVYEAIDRECDRRVAIKVLNQVSPKELLRLKNEYRLLRDIRHPNLIRLGELCEHEGVWLFTMELIEGSELRSYVRCKRRDQHPRYDEDRLRACLFQLACGLAAIHRADALHRDIKPSNIMVTGDGRLVLLDFGYALGPQGDTATTPGTVVGTSEYMAPEQAVGGRIGPASDWYSVGVVLYELLTGKLPFSGSHQSITLQKHRVAPPHPRFVAPWVAPDLDALCARLLCPRPNERASGAAVLAALGHQAVPEVVAPPEHGVAAPGRFVGRAAEMAVLHSWFRAPAATATATSTRAYRDGATGCTSPALVLLRGESGIGKTALVQHFADELRQQGVQVFGSRCCEYESVPYRAVDEFMDGLIHYLLGRDAEQRTATLPADADVISQVFPVFDRLAPLRPPQQRDAHIDAARLRGRVFRAIAQLFANLATRTRLLLVIEDLQWADTDSLALLAHLLTSWTASYPLLLATERTERTVPPNESPLWIPERSQHIDIGPLSRIETIELARRGLGVDLTQSRAAQIAEQSAGHPLFALELARQVHSHGAVPNAPVQRVEQLLWERAVAIGRDARRILELLAVARAPLDLQVAARTLAMPFGAFSRCVEQLRDGNLVRVTGARRTDAIEVYHSRVRTAVLARTSAAVRAKVHGYIAAALEASLSDDVETLAQHWLDAGELDKARIYLRLAAERASAALAFEQAANLWHKLLDLRPGLADETVCRCHTALGDALACLGRPLAAAEQFLAATGATNDAAVALGNQIRAMEQLLNGGYVERGMAVLDGLMHKVKRRMPRSPRRVLLAIMARRIWQQVWGWRLRPQPSMARYTRQVLYADLWWAVAFNVGAVDLPLSAWFRAQFAHAALRAGDARRVACAYALEAGIIALRGSRSAHRTARWLARAQELAERSQHPHAQGIVHLYRAICAYLESDWRQAEPLCRVAARFLAHHCRDVTRELSVINQISYLVLAHRGDFNNLKRRLLPAIEDADNRGDRYAATVFRLSWTNLLWLALDQPEVAQAQVDHALASWPHAHKTQQHYFGLVAQIHIDRYCGRPDDAWARFATAWRSWRPMLRRLQLWRMQFLQLRGATAVALAEQSPVGDQRRFYLKCAMADRKRLDREPNHAARGQAAMLQAGIHAIEDKLDRATQALHRARDQFAHCGMEVHRAIAVRRLGEIARNSTAAYAVQTADRDMAAHGVANPSRMAALLCPGFDNRP